MNERILGRIGPPALLGLAVLVLGPSTLVVAAAEKPYGGDIRVVHERVVIEVNDDASFVETADVLIEVLTEQGIAAMNQRSFAYSESMQEIELLSAYTLKKDGQRLDVPERNIQQRDVVASGGPMFSDIKAKVVVFPDVAAGDRIGYTLRNTQKVAMFPGEFSMIRLFPEVVAHGEVEVTLSVPKAMPIQVHANGVDGGKIKDSKTQRHWKWTYRNERVALPEVGAVDALTYLPQILATSFKDYGAIAAAYEARARPLATVNERVRELAKSITADETAPRAQAERLYTWVSRNIRYAGNCIGIGSVIPHDIDTILDNKLGDCKDHTVLLQALLEVVGIASTPVLVNSGDIFSLPPVPVPGVFNHVITYIPSLDVYADATPDFVPFGVLPIAESGKPVLHTRDFKAVSRTPALDAENLRSEVHTEMVIAGDGSVQGSVRVADSLAVASGVRSTFSGLSPELEKRVAQQILSSRGYIGTATLENDDPIEAQAPYRYGLRFSLEDAVDVARAGALYPATLMDGAMSLSLLTAAANQPKATRQRFCAGGFVINSYRYELPEAMKVLSLPKNVQVTVGSMRYSSTYRQEGNVLMIERRAEDPSSTGVCSAEEFERQRAIIKPIIDDLRAPILYEMQTLQE